MKKGIIAVIAIVVVVIVIAALAKKTKTEAPDYNMQTQGEVTMADGVYTLDTTGTTIGWEASKIGKSHTGGLTVRSGELTVVDGVPATSVVTIDMKGITNTDIEGAEEKAKLVGHLSSPDFFDVAKYPTAQLSLASWKKTNEGFMMDADLTIKGVTKRVTVPVNVTENGSGFTLTGEFSINQKDFKILNNPAFDAIINDTIVLNFTTAWQTK